MNTSPDHPQQGENARRIHTSGESGPTSWTEALGTLICTRLAIFTAESKDVVQVWVKKLTMALAAALLLLFAWALLLAGGTTAVAAATGWEWYWVALGTGGAHLLMALILLGIVKSKSSAGFHYTKTEFYKDREWLKNLSQKDTTSPN